MKISEAERYTRQQLNALYEESEAANIASLALEHITTLPKADRLLKKDALLSAGQLSQLESCIQRLQQHEPIQYIMNKAWFYGMELFVNNAVLIPRPETE